MKKFVVEFNHMGGKFTMALEAEDHDDAMRRVRSAFYNGEAYELKATVPIPSWMAKTIG